MTMISINRVFLILIIITLLTLWGCGNDEEKGLSSEKTVSGEDTPEENRDSAYFPHNAGRNRPSGQYTRDNHRRRKKSACGGFPAE